MYFSTNMVRYLALALMESMYGDISPNFRKIWITLDEENLTTIRVLLERQNERDMEATEDIVTDFEAKLTMNIDLKLDVVVSDEPMNVVPKHNVPHRYVYIRHEAWPNEQVGRVY